MIRQFLLLNGIAVIGAVVQHASGWGFTSLVWWTDRYTAVPPPDYSQLGTGTYYALRLIEQITIFPPPAFLFVTGFFVAFAAGARQDLSWTKVGSRIRMLVIPYVVWSVLIFLLRAFEGAVDTPWGYLHQLVTGQAAAPYYYVPLVIQAYLLAPFLISWMRKRWKIVLVSAASIQLAVQLARYPVMLGWDIPAATWIAEHAPGWFFPQTIFWFVSGVVAGFHLPALRASLVPFRRVLPAAAALLCLAALVEWEMLLSWSGKDWLSPAPTVLDTFYSGSLILTFLAFAGPSLPAQRQLDALGQRSFGVYLIHAPVLEFVSRASYHATPILLGHQMVFVTLLIVAGLGIPLLLMTMVNRTPVRPYYNYLFG